MGSLSDFVELGVLTRVQVGDVVGAPGLLHNGLHSLDGS
jgi:hypothetical protein